MGAEKKKNMKNIPFDVEAFVPHWQARLIGNWKQWVCTQTKQTSQQIQQGQPIERVGGNSNAMALRYASMYALYDSEESIVDAARKTMFTSRTDRDSRERILCKSGVQGRAS